MIEFKLPDWGSVRLIESLGELPLLESVDTLILDLETTSEDNKYDSLNPWHTCKILGVSLSFNDSRLAYYIPVRHRGAQRFSNLSPDRVALWLKDLFERTRRWANHNIKYDMNVLKNDFGIIFNGEIVDTLSLAKLAPREERFTYNLTDILKEWYQVDISEYERTIKQYINKDYGVCPVDLMAEYAGVDVLCTKFLLDSLENEIPGDCWQVVQMEKRLTPALFHIEQAGMKLNEEKIRSDYFVLQAKMALLGGTIQGRVGIPGFRPHVNGDCYKYFCERLSLPVLEFTEKNQPSFGESALIAYKTQATVDPEIVDMILDYKHTYKLFTSFTSSYIKLNVDWRVHGSYNQIVRTGRMSMREPNMQQLSEEAKDYIIPSAPDRILLDFDYSQIEFRVIVHYIDAKKCIADYNRDPNTDFHDWVAKMCNIPRRPAKNINFMLGYGGGKKKCLLMLSMLPDVTRGVDNVEEKALEVYNAYHRALPTLIPTRNHAMAVMNQRGYVRTLMGRRRYISREFTYKAFNTVCQGSAADMMKSATLRLVDYLSDKPEIKLIGIVHDSWILDAPRDVDPEPIRKLLEECPIPFSVPIRCNYKTSDTTWRHCE